ncbi:endonuclease NucS [Candidatus Bathyarchaeota archaeon]|nr:endonuclease NucS [Candidatus Bathyarchaeota archaeon]
MTKCESINYPSIEDIIFKLRYGIKNRRNILIVSNCLVNYKGRASSKLSEGERIIILKPDGSALIHRPKDYPPVNWQPPGSLFRVKTTNQNVVVRVFRKKENEVLEIELLEVILLAILDLKDNGEFNLFASEKDMQEAILLQPSLIEEKFRPITSERHVLPGFIDILGYDKDGRLTVIEIKRKKATKQNVLQLKKYIDSLNVEEKRNIRGILVAPELGKGSQELLLSLGYESRIISPQECSAILNKQKTNTKIDYFFKK